MMFKRDSKYKTQTGEVMRKCLYWQSTKIRETVQKVRAKNTEPKRNRIHEEHCMYKDKTIYIYKRVITQ